jgi:peptidoglycan/xylan/chitin deacetylase (PgdA/CDA1 family)
VKQAIKTFLGGLMYTSRLHAVLPANAAVVVAFHRIDDARGLDSLTIDRDMFERYCAFFKQNFNVISLSDLVRRLDTRQPLHRHLAITFDDGYLDNYENAAPVLKDLSLPATFFVVSRWMGSDIVPWWDAERGVRYPWMTWAHVRTLHKEGFDIGVHTRTHVDLGIADEPTAREEIAGARADVENELGTSPDLFAYPYGRHTNMAERTRDLVRAAGFRCCCSCAGGITAASTNPFFLPRVPISHWYKAPHHFGFEIALEMMPTAA